MRSKILDLVTNLWLEAADRYRQELSDVGIFPAARLAVAKLANYCRSNWHPFERDEFGKTID
jgi:hypothetical protein